MNGHIISSLCLPEARIKVYNIKIIYEYSSNMIKNYVQALRVMPRAHFQSLRDMPGDTDCL